jgi:uncharacterized protein YhbP (UPF0306 family)
MPQIKIAFQYFEYGDHDLNCSLQAILESTELLSLATVNGSSAWINTAFYCYNDSLDLFFLSEPTTQHSKNLEANPSVAATIFESQQPWGPGKLRGLQIFGDCRCAVDQDLVEGTHLYMTRFPPVQQWIKSPDDFDKGIINSRIYVLHPTRAKLFDESTFGTEIFINLSIPTGQ